MIAVSWTGQIYGLDSFTGAWSLLGMGMPGQNASCRDDHGRIWTTGNGNVLTVLDLNPPAATNPLPGFTVDLRGLANGGAQYLLGIENGPVDNLVRIDKSLGTKVTIGPTGFANIEALASHRDYLYAWDTTYGLLLIDGNNGAATDVNPGLGNGGAQIEWLSTRSDGKLVGGQNSLYEIDIVTGVPTLIANLGPIDLRGADAIQTYTRQYGNGCNGTAGPVNLSVSVTGTMSRVVTLQSGNHAANRIGATIFGLSTMNYGSGPLPLLLDPIVGTSGCWLYTSSHASALGITTNSSPATLDFQFTFPLPNDLFAFSVQQVVLEPVAGGMSTSNGVLVQLGR